MAGPAAGPGQLTGRRVSGAGFPRRTPDRAIAGLVALLTLVLLLVLDHPLSSDVSGQLWLADRLRHGVQLYVDIAEINPPLWFWLAVPIDAVAAVAGIAADRALIVAIGCAAWLALAGAEPLIGLPRPRRRLLLGYAALVMLVMPAWDFGQREQLALIAALPYAALLAARRERRRVSLWLAGATGAGAALGFALKHYFLGAPLLLELWLAFGLRRDWRPVRPETAALVGVGLAYAAAVLLVTPAYPFATIPDLRLAYRATDIAGLAGLIGPAQLVWLVLLAALLALRRQVADAPLAGALAVAAFGFGAAWLIQHKGWPYQGIAVTGCLALALAATLDRAGRGPALLRLTAPALLALPLALALIPTRRPPPPAGDIAPGLAGLRDGVPIAILSTEAWGAWPAAHGHRFRIATRYGQYWMLRAVDARPGDPRTVAFGRRVVRNTVADFRCLPPQRLIAVRPVRGSRSATDDPLGYLLRDPAFAALFGHYRHFERHGIIDSYGLARPLPPPAGPCRRD